MGRVLSSLEAGVTWVQQYAEPPLASQFAAKLLSPRAATSTVGAAMAKAARLRMVVIAENFILTIEGSKDG